MRRKSLSDFVDSLQAEGRYTFIAVIARFSLNASYTIYAITDAKELKPWQLLSDMAMLSLLGAKDNCDVFSITQGHGLAVLYRTGLQKKSTLVVCYKV